MLRISLAFMSVVLLLASTARAQMRGGGTRGGSATSMSALGTGGCVSGSNTTGTTSFMSSTAGAGGANAMGFGSNPASAYLGMGGTPIASTAAAAYGTTASTAAAYYGMSGYGVTAWSNPYAQVNNAYGYSSLGGFGAMNGMSDGSSSFGWGESNLPSDPFAAALAAADWSSTDTTPRTRSKSTKSQSKLKQRSKRAKGASR
jgi:hypothetical protein